MARIEFRLVRVSARVRLVGSRRVWMAEPWSGGQRDGFIGVARRGRGKKKLCLCCLVLEGVVTRQRRSVVEPGVQWTRRGERSTFTIVLHYSIILLIGAMESGAGVDLSSVSAVVVDIEGTVCSLSYVRNDLMYQLSNILLSSSIEY